MEPPAPCPMEPPGAPGQTARHVHKDAVSETARISARAKAYASLEERRAKMLENVRYVMKKHKQVLDALARR